MALTPDDVVTKQFQHVRFKEGFDPDEVDDFLDEIVVEWRKTIAENEELKAKLAALESGQAAVPVATPAPAAAATSPAPTAVPEQPVASDGPPSTASAGIIELAQRLHDEHVAEGRAKRDQLIAEAQTQAAGIVAEAESRVRDQQEQLNKERITLEARITELRQFERDYRSQLRSYIEGKLRDLEATTTTSGSTPVSSIGL